MGTNFAMDMEPDDIGEVEADGSGEDGIRRVVAAWRGLAIGADVADEQDSRVHDKEGAEMGPSGHFEPIDLAAGVPRNGTAVTEVSHVAHVAQSASRLSRLSRPPAPLTSFTSLTSLTSLTLRLSRLSSAWAMTESYCACSWRSSTTRSSAASTPRATSQRHRAVRRAARAGRLRRTTPACCATPARASPAAARLVTAGLARAARRVLPPPSRPPSLRSPSTAAADRHVRELVADYLTPHTPPTRKHPWRLLTDGGGEMGTNLTGVKRRIKILLKDVATNNSEYRWLCDNDYHTVPDGLVFNVLDDLG